MKKDQPELWTRNFISVSATNFFLFMTFYFLLVTLPIYVVENLGGEKSEAGLMTTVFLLSAILIRPFAGRWIEKHGGRKVLLFSLFVFLTATILYFFVSSITALMAVRFLHGIGFGIATTCTGAIVADIIPDSRRGEGMGYFILSSTLAMVIGPYVGLTAMQEWGVNAMLDFAAGSAVACVLAGNSIRVKKKQIQEQKERVQNPFNLKNLFEASAVPIAVTGSLFALAYSAILSFVSVYAGELGLGGISSYFFVVYAVVLLLSRPFTGKCYDLYGQNVIVYPAIVLFAIGMLLLGITDSAFLFLAAAACAGLGWGTLFPTYQTIAIQSAPPKRKAMATATFLSIFDIGIGLGSYIVGLAASLFSFRQLYLFGSAYILLGGTLIYYLLAGRKFHHIRKNEQEAVL
ncbi:MFS transporter [Mesobacillus zeae]|uniref:MFS transporter n=1 Tax=Mesobacillus zeae TaxID=1917180 RepID=A0A398BD86_9BACI|nr:MFS transporter [Mesobacillus zeae]RID85720.1 MFS transporter [Mesobacillus zeae]